MESVTRGVRVVKTPRIPRPDEEEDCCAADRALAAAATGPPAEDWGRRPIDPRTAVERYMIPVELAYFLAYGRIE